MKTIEKFEVRNRWTGAVQFTAEISATPDMFPSIKLGLAVDWARKNGADLRGADLRGADLRDADLRGADLRGANLYGEILSKSPIMLTGLLWNVIITEGFMAIGGQRHAHADWESFDDEVIADMHDDALDFWRVHKDALLAMCKAHKEKKGEV